MSERDNIFARIREALTIAAPKPMGSDQTIHGTGSYLDPVAQNKAKQLTASSSAVNRGEIRNWLPQVGESFNSRLELFRNNASALKADFHLVDNLDQLNSFIVRLRDAEQWKKVSSHTSELTAMVTTKLGLPLCTTDKGYNSAELESCNVAITECDALIAQTGSVLVTSRSAGGRGLSVLPPHHVVLARREQLVADLPEAFDLLKKKYAPNYPSFICFITGPSRTGDIERILVLGAHGPKQLTIFCI